MKSSYRTVRYLHRASGGTGSLGCHICEVGRYAAVESAECTDCAAGTFAPDMETGECTKCPGGFFANTQARVSCDM